MPVRAKATKKPKAKQPRPVPSRLGSPAPSRQRRLPSDELTIVEAAHRAGITEQAMRLWVKRYAGLGRRVVGRWRVNGAALARLLTGEKLRERRGRANTSPA